MIGNDIIDLNSAGSNSRWQEQRFLDKLFTSEEQAFILKDESRFQNIWRLWSMKESAYKIFHRQLTSTVFNPKSFVCHVNCDTTGLVFFEDHKVPTTTENSSNYYYTTAQYCNKHLINEFVVLEGSPAQKQHQLRDKAIRAYADLKSISVDSISIMKNVSGIPEIYHNQMLQESSLTLTHHGRYGGFAISY